MADKRRLQGEIDKCLKKVQDGCTEFDDIWHKFNQSGNHTQKEKFEQDLKKEIKKLQRLRDQIKTWMNTNDIRDKDQLAKARKDIETRMERFKVVEKETKTKAYSKEGLGAHQKLDPSTKEKREVETWLRDCVSNLEQQIEQMDCDIESLGKASNKKRKDRNKEEKLDSLKRHIERHRYHINKLETLLRLLDNDAVQSKQILDIRETVDYYLDSNQDDDFMEDEFMYDDLDEQMDEQVAEQFTVQTTAVVHSESLENESRTTNHSKEESTRRRHRSSTNSEEGQSTSNGPTSIHIKEKELVTITKPPVSQQNSVESKSSSSTTKITINQRNTTSPLNNNHNMASQISYSNVASEHVPASQPASHTTSSTETRSNPSQSATPSSLSDISIPNSTSVPSPPPSGSNDVKSPREILKEPEPSLINDALLDLDNSTKDRELPTLIGELSLKEEHLKDTPQTNGQTKTSTTINGIISKPLADQLSNQRNMSSSVKNSNNSKTLSSTTSEVKLRHQPDLESSSQQPVIPSRPESKTGNTTIRLKPLLGIAPLGPLKLTSEHHRQQEMLSAALQHMPIPSDSERVRSYLPRNPIATPSYYPQSLNPLYESPEYFQRLSSDTLFFIFYYMEGTKAQYLAAKALKKQSWRFHTKFHTWFQRHDEPKMITDEFEQGCYIFFDFEKWTQRRKVDFTFEYKYLEDRELP